jgi:hypothetical protein
LETRDYVIHSKSTPQKSNFNLSKN